MGLGGTNEESARGVKKGGAKDGGLGIQSKVSYTNVSIDPVMTSPSGYLSMTATCGQCSSLYGLTTDEKARPRHLRCFRDRFIKHAACCIQQQTCQCHRGKHLGPEAASRVDEHAKHPGAGVATRTTPARVATSPYKAITVPLRFLPTLSLRLGGQTTQSQTPRRQEGQSGAT